MTKTEFLRALQARLAALPPTETEERVRFYEEMIDDRVEDGMREEEAVAAVGTVEEIAAQIAEEIPFLKIAKAYVKPKRRPATWEIVLLAVGAPLWLSLFLAVVAVVLSLYISLWVVVVSLWACFASLTACGVCGAVLGVVTMIWGDLLAGGALLGAGLILGGFAIFLFFVCRAATKGTAWLLTAGIKRGLVRKEAV